MVRTFTRSGAAGSPRVISPCRRELINIQEAIVKNLKKEITRSVGKGTKESQAYLDEYMREFDHYERRSSWGELISAVRRAKIVYNGDYHTMAQAQRIPLRILRDVCGHNRKITLALELVRIERQGELDRFMAGGFSEQDFLKAIDYDRTWGFPWQQYRDLFLFAQQNSIRVVGINSEPRKGRGKLRRRDQAAARVIAREHLENRDRLIYVFDGDLHIAPGHLPMAVDSLLAEFDVHPEKVIVYQNSEKVYWDLARMGIEQETDVILMSEGQFCVMSTAPIIKVQSYLNWIDNTRELASPYPRSWGLDWVGAGDLYSQVLQLVKMIAGFLGIEAEGFDDFVVYSPGDLDFLDRLLAEEGLSVSEVREIAEHIGTNESYFIEKGNIIYVANLSINHAAEEAAHFIHKLCAGPMEPDLTQVGDFYCRLMHEAIGFLGSKIVNHKRPCYTLDDFKNPRRRHPTKPPERIAQLKDIGRFVRKHKRFEENFISKGRLWDLDGPMYQLSPAVHIGVTHALGYMLGEQLFNGLMSGTIAKDTIRDLFFVNFSDLTQALGIYLDCVATLT
jgi:hypothetical protein